MKDPGEMTIQEIAAHASKVRSAAVSIRAKQTSIILENKTRREFDSMLTRYYYRDNGETLDDVIVKMMGDMEVLFEIGIEIERWKLEKEIPFMEECFEECKYVEVHQGLIVDSEKLSYAKQLGDNMGWRPSNNPRASLGEGLVKQFLNRRFNNKMTYFEINEEIERLHARVGYTSDIMIERPRVELVVIDSNLEHDSWWSAVNV